VRAVVLSVLLAASLGHAEDQVPDALGLMVMLKVVSYDTAFASHGSGDFVVLVPFAPGQESKAVALAAVGTTLEVKTIKERALHFLPTPLAELDSKKGTAVLLYFGFPADTLKTTLEKARAQKLYVLTFEEARVRDGVLLGVGLSNGKPQPLVNVAAARAIGADFGPVLRLARTFQ
jgi:hypothetical protein